MTQTQKVKDIFFGQSLGELVATLGMEIVPQHAHLCFLPEKRER